MEHSGRHCELNSVWAGATWLGSARQGYVNTLARAKAEGNVCGCALPVIDFRKACPAVYFYVVLRERA